MKNKIKKIFLSMIILSTNCLFAQFPDPDAPLPGDNNPLDGPINGMHCLYMLIIFAIVFAFIVIEKKRMSKLH